MGGLVPATNNDIRTFSMGWAGFIQGGADLDVMIYDLTGTATATMKNYVAYIIKID